MEEFFKNYNWIIGLLVQGFIAYHILVISRRTSISAFIERKAELQNTAQKIIHEAYQLKTRRTAVSIINIKELSKYPNSGFFADSIKSTLYEGVEVFIWGGVKLYKNNKNEITRKSKGNTFFKEVHMTGIIPYKWIEKIEPSGDEYYTRARIYCRFKKYEPIFKFKPANYNFKNFKNLFSIDLFYFGPYNVFNYYTLNPDYIEGKNHYWEEYDYLCSEKELKNLLIENSPSNSIA